MAEKRFTLDEANSLLPVMESLLLRAMKAKQTMEAVDKEMQELGHRVFLSGGLLVDVPKTTRRRAERERAVQQIKDTLAEIHAAGAQVKDLDIGLLDFPCDTDGGTVLLCWKYGEPKKIAYWHGLEEGFAGRKPISALTLHRKKPKPEKPN